MLAPLFLVLACARSTARSLSSFDLSRAERTRLPKHPSEADFESYKTLAAGLCEATDGACIASQLVRMAQGLTAEALALQASLYGRALALHPEQEAACTSSPTLSLEPYLSSSKRKARE